MQWVSLYGVSKKYEVIAICKKPAAKQSTQHDPIFMNKITSYWSELRTMATPSCRGAWEKLDLLLRKTVGNGY